MPFPDLFSFSRISSTTKLSTFSMLNASERLFDHALHGQWLVVRSMWPFVVRGGLRILAGNPYLSKIVNERRKGNETQDVNNRIQLDGAFGGVCPCDHGCSRHKQLCAGGD
jgi:hypothetical protein